MQPRTEALLTVRDGEPIDAAERDELLADPASVAEVERLRRTQAALEELPEFDPPAGVWQRIEAELDGDRRRRIGVAFRWAAGAAVAATVATAAIIYLAQSFDAPGIPTATTAADESPRPSATGSIMPASYTQLVEESARLERLLAEIPYQRPLMTAQTASTIVGLEDRITMLDEELAFGAANDMEMSQREALWEERVELMNALLHVRYAQAQRTGF
jgi:hypothetical protein